jgi:hypothetical protein
MLEGRKPVPMPPQCPTFMVNFFDVETQSITSNGPQDAEVSQLSANTISVSIQSGR